MTDGQELKEIAMRHVHVVVTGPGDALDAARDEVRMALNKFDWNAIAQELPTTQTVPQQPAPLDPNEIKFILKHLPERPSMQYIVQRLTQLLAERPSSRSAAIGMSTTGLSRKWSARQND